MVVASGVLVPPLPPRASAYEYSILTVSVSLKSAPVLSYSCGVVNRLPHYGESTRSRADAGVNVVVDKTVIVVA